MVRQIREDTTMADPFVDIPNEVFRAIRDKILQNSETSSELRLADWRLNSWTYGTFDFNINYGDLSVSSSKPVTLDRSEFTNCTTQTSDETWQRSKTTKDSYSWTNQTGWKLGGGIKVPIPIPVVSAEPITFEYSGENSTTQTQEVERAWQIGTTFHVAPHTQVTADWHIFEDEFKSDFTGTIRPRGMQIVVLITLPITTTSSVPPVQLPFNVDDFLTPDERTFRSTGTFTAIQGNRAIINTAEAAARCDTGRFQLPFETGQLSTVSQRSMEQLQELVAAPPPRPQR
jgi:hypothetical protein